LPRSTEFIQEFPVVTLKSEATQSVPVHLVSISALDAWLAECPPATQAWLTANAFQAKTGQTCILPAAGDGSTSHSAMAGVVVGVGDGADLWSLGHLPSVLRSGDYHLADPLDEALVEGLAIGWELGTYRFDRYKSVDPIDAGLVVASSKSRARAAHVAEAIAFARDLINTPASDMGPSALQARAQALAEQFGATMDAVVGDELLSENFPAIHAVGRASADAPRLIDLRWGRVDAPRVTLVGKGVCFDSGGLDIKPASGMRLMKKDMGGGAHALALGQLIMASGLDVRLRVLVCAVENSISGNAYRPGDVLQSRKGITIEVDNTDAEGRIVLCDALCEASAETPEIVVDFATLTGAARVALGTDIPAMFSNDDVVAARLQSIGLAINDPVWQLPLPAAYDALLSSNVADTVNSASVPYGGAITAALFLQKFVEPDVSWVHYDLMAWNVKTRPGRPEGGEAMGLRTTFAYLEERFG
jgi:leucyl aminopeptidase